MQCWKDFGRAGITLLADLSDKIRCAMSWLNVNVRIARHAAMMTVMTIAAGRYWMNLIHPDRAMLTRNTGIPAHT